MQTLCNNCVVSHCSCDQDALNWAAPSESFPKSVQLLSLPTYQYSALLGLIVSVGGLTESLVNHSSSSFLQYLKQISSRCNVCLSVYLSVCLSVHVYLSVCLSTCLPACLRVCLSVYLSVCLSVCLSITYT